MLNCVRIHKRVVNQKGYGFTMRNKFFAAILLVATFQIFAAPAHAETFELVEAREISAGIPAQLDSLVENPDISLELASATLGISQLGQVQGNVYIPRENDSALTFFVSPSNPGRLFSETEQLATSTDLENNVQHVAEIAANSLRFLAESETAEAAKVVEYRTNLPADCYLLLLHDGDYQIIDGEGTYFGTLRAPWALDQEGTKYESRFTLVDGMLSQNSDIPNSAPTPIVTDPSWTYLFDFSQHIEDNGSTGIPPTIYYSSRSPQFVTSLLKSCFNCYFPVQGAPSSYPYVGQIMPLYIYNPIAFGFITYNANVRVSRVINYGWDFTALTGHIDGAGSTIKFSWYSDASARLHLKIDAYIVNNNPIDLPGTSVDFDRGIYTSQARATWQSFFNSVT